MNIPDLRNKKLEVTDIDEIKKFLNRATTIRVSFNSGEGYQLLYHYHMDMNLQMMINSYFTSTVDLMV